MGAAGGTRRSPRQVNRLRLVRADLPVQPVQVPSHGMEAL